MTKKHGENPTAAQTAVDEEVFTAGQESDKDFERVLVLLAGWLKAGIVNVDVKPDGTVRFDLPGEMRDLFGGELPEGLTEQQVVEIIKAEMPALTTAGFMKHPIEYLRYRVPESLHDRLSDLAKRAEKAVATLAIGELRERILLRRTTLSYVMKEVRSLSGSYESRLPTGEKSNLPFTTVEFSFVRPRGGAAMFLMDAAGEGMVSLSPKDEVQVRVDFHKADMKAFVKELTEILEEKSE